MSRNHRVTSSAGSARIGYLAAVLVASFAALAGFAQTDLAGAIGKVEFPLDRFEGTHENLTGAAEPMQAGALALRVSSPKNSITLEDALLTVRRAERHWHRVEATVVFSGSGTMVTEVLVGSLPARFEDEVRFPRQERRVGAWVSVERLAEDYLLTVEDTDEPVEIEVESQLAQKVLGLCRGVSLFTAGGGGCDDLEYLMSHPRVPLPAVGKEFVLDGDALTPDERARLDLYLASADLLSSE